MFLKDAHYILFNGFIWFLKFVVLNKLKDTNVCNKTSAIKQHIGSTLTEKIWKHKKIIQHVTQIYEQIYHSKAHVFRG